MLNANAMALGWTFLTVVGMTFIQMAYTQDCPQDVVFIVDRAAYIQSSSPQTNLNQNWNLIKTFLNNVLGRMRYGVPNTQLSTVTFGSDSTAVFNLNTYPTSAGAANAITNLDYMSAGLSNVASAFRLTRTSVLTTANGKRSTAPSICLFLVTYPPTTEVNNTVPERDALKAVCRLIVFGVADAGRLSSLSGTYLSYANAGDYFSAAFTSLNSTDVATQIINSITVACPTTPVPPTTPTTTTTTFAPPIGCTGTTGADLVIALDSSGSIGAPNFDKAKAFVISLVLNLNIDSGLTRVGLFTFSDTFHHYFHLNSFTTRGQIVAAINNVTYTPGTTNTAVALNHARTDMFLSSNGARDQIPPIFLILTDGGSNDRVATSTEAALLRKTGTIIFVIGLGTWLYEPELFAIAGYPYFTVREISDYNNLPAAAADYVALICQNVKGCSSNPCQNGGVCVDIVGYYICQCTSGFGGQNCQLTCRVKSDIVFAIDAAWCLSYEDYKRQLDFIRNVTLGLNDADTQVGVLVYSNMANVTFNLSDFPSNRKLSELRGISTLYSGGATNMTAAVVTARDQMFTAATGDRPDAPNILVIVTAGQSADINATVREAMKARNTNLIQIVVVAVGTGTSQAELEGTASYPVANNIFNAPDFSSLTGIITSVTQTACNNVNECASNPCQNGGSCVDLLNGYSCTCDATHTGVNCERVTSGIMDVVFAIDTSGTSSLIIDFAVSVVQSLEVNPSKARIGALIYSSTSTSVFELNTYTTKQDVIWGLKQIASSGIFSSSTTTNTASALQILKDVKFTSANGDRNNVQNFALFFTNINSNVNPINSVPVAITTRISDGGIYIISFGIGDFVYLPELVAISSVAGYPVLLINNNLTVFKANRFQDLPSYLNPYLGALIGDQSKCNSNPCMNGGTCLNDVKKFSCQCSTGYSGETCSRRCARQIDVAILLDISASGDVGHAVDWNINLARQVILGLPIRSGGAAAGVVAFGNGANVSFYLNTYSSKDDILNALSFRLTSGPNGLQSAFQLLTTDFFTSAHGSRGGVAQVAIVITSSDFPDDYSGIVQAAAAARSANIEVYAVSLGDGPRIEMINALASNTTASHVYTGSLTSDIGTVAGNLLNTLCQ